MVEVVDRRPRRHRPRAVRHILFWHRLLPVLLLIYSRLPVMLIYSRLSVLLLVHTIRLPVLLLVRDRLSILLQIYRRLSVHLLIGCLPVPLLLHLLVASRVNVLSIYLIVQGCGRSI